MQARLNGTVIAEAEDDDLIRIEGNWYFPPDSVNHEYLQESPTPYTCAWKGECQYYSVVGDDGVLQDRAWSYPEPYPSAIERVGKDFSGHIAFWKEVEVAASPRPGQ
ncbi:MULTISPECIES: DUF427 domain-containing protein [unclassified Microbacterium]|uniref:DUF427 domain-containing protein n=1 Tax=unclassified Microbacterium TaxID=2609290 RepID=UPI00214B0B19|nr:MULTISPECIES: DUF427 domain-containing protein [unclassified Microbacterium]MCR2809646.1 DUF427 domain-containing protein [Microbacterium sp. zg.B185]WIM18030.1 DUF427 domain-containing protein [Microbacterium sp. zg-B185]